MGCRRARPAARRSPSLRRSAAAPTSTATSRSRPASSASSTSPTRRTRFPARSTICESSTCLSRRRLCRTGAAGSTVRRRGRGVERLDVGPRVPPAVRDQVRDHRVLLIERRREVPDAPDPLSLRADEGRPKEVGEEARPRHQVLVCWRTSGTVTRTRASTATQPSGATSTGFRSSSATSGRSSPSAESRCRRSITESASAGGLPR